MQILCPDCDSSIDLDFSLEIDDIVECEECGAELLITQIEPSIKFRLIEEEK